MMKSTVAPGGPAYAEPEVFHFSCTACGKCCNTPPMATLGESLRLHREFVFQPISNHVGKTDDPQDVAFRQAAYHPVGVPAIMGETQVGAGLIMVPIGYQTERCPKLIDGKCSIYEIRPTRCRAVPFEPNMPRAWTGRLLAEFADAVEQMGYECRLDPDADLIWTRGEGILGEWERAYDGMRAALTASGPAGKAFFADHHHEVRHAIMSDMEFTPPFAMLLVWLVTARGMGTALAREVSMAQINLGEAEIAKAMTRRDKSERPVTATMRALADMHRQALTVYDEIERDDADAKNHTPAFAAELARMTAMPGRAGNTAIAA